MRRWNLRRYLNERGAIGGAPSAAELFPHQGDSVSIPAILNYSDHFELGPATTIRTVTIINLSHFWVGLAPGARAGGSMASYKFLVPPFTPQATYPWGDRYTTVLVGASPTGNVAQITSDEFISLNMSSDVLPLANTASQANLTAGGASMTKSVTAGNGSLQAQPADIWVPAAGKTIRLWTAVLETDTAGVLTLNEVTPANAQVQIVANIPAVVINVPFAYPPFFPNGFKLSAAGNKLRLLNSGGGAVNATLTGDEE